MQQEAGVPRPTDRGLFYAGDEHITRLLLRRQSAVVSYLCRRHGGKDAAGTHGDVVRVDAPAQDTRTDGARGGLPG